MKWLLVHLITWVALHLETLLKVSRDGILTAMALTSLTKIGTKLFVMNKDGNEDEWWSDFDLDDDNYEVDDDGECFCGVALKAVNKRVALGLSSDLLPDIEHAPLNEGAIPNNLEDATALMAKYRDGCNSWMCKHLEVSRKAAFQIREYVTPAPVFYLEPGDREYVTPAPVFYLEPGDLVMELEESLMCEWHKTLVFRKDA
jgi:hypothetical protein